MIICASTAPINDPIKASSHRVAQADELELHATVIRQILKGAELEFGVTLSVMEGAESARES